MISMVVATHNRAYTLEKVAYSFFEQEMVSQVIFVLDGCTDNTEDALRDIAASYPNVSLVIACNETRMGQCHSRNVGIAQASNDYILFCDDDEYMQQGYAKTCFEKFNAYKDVGVISGRRIYLRKGETMDAALSRFGTGLYSSPPYLRVICEYVNGARFDGDLSIPIVNAIMLTSKKRLLDHPFDPHYANGNGYREESDFQMNLFINGYNNYVTNDCHTFHLPMESVRKGGQRAKFFRRVYWSCKYTAYFFEKYYGDYAKKYRISVPKQAALALFAGFYIYREGVRPYLRTIYFFVMNR